MSWTLAIDFGTSFTVAAVATDNAPPEVLEVDGYSRMPSLVMLDPQGRLLAGRAAVNEAGLFPDRVERAPKRYVGITDYLSLGDQMVWVADAVATVLGRVAAEARRRHNGAPPDQVVLTHPARWADAPLECLKAASTAAGLPPAFLLPEPVAAAMAYTEVHVSPGDHVAVYDLGGGTFDTAVLQRNDGRFEVAGPPGGDAHLGGEVFDEQIVELLGEQLAARDQDRWQALSSPPDRRWARAHDDFLTQVRSAKEQLSDQVDATLYVGPFDTDLRITRDEFEGLIRQDLESSVDELLGTVQAAQKAPSELVAVYLTGGSSRIPLAASLVHERFQRLPATRGDPKSVVALGAIRMVEPPRTSPRRTPPPPESPSEWVRMEAGTASLPTISSASSPPDRSWREPVTNMSPPQKQSAPRQIPRLSMDPANGGHAWIPATQAVPVQQQVPVQQSHMPVQTYLVPAILVTLFCCLPTGIVAIVFAAQVKSKESVGDIVGARTALNRAKIWTWVSFGLGVLVMLIYVAMLASAPSYE
jgi:hypothetical protein